MLHQIAPYFGYLASLCLIIALLVNNDLKFRWFNSFGNVFFITYAVLLLAIPVMITNVILLCINLYYLIKIYSKKENFDLLEFNGDEKLTSRFIDFYWNDINAYFPNFKPEALQGNLNFVVTRDVVIANIFSAALTNNGDAYVALNYTLPKYRDYKVGTYIFEKEKDFLISKGVKRIVYTMQLE
ncbi:MAG: hypothetical protein EOO43_20660 [Flavobacterium sp.]|nr:MAG: hypothetical protein EOO43_20660 [Flavobacterium sp.]